MGTVVLSGGGGMVRRAGLRVVGVAAWVVAFGPPAVAAAAGVGEIREVRGGLSSGSGRRGGARGGRVGAGWGGGRGCGWGAGGGGGRPAARRRSGGRRGRGRSPSTRAA